MKKSLNGNTDTVLNTVMRTDKHIRGTAQAVTGLCGKSEHQKTHGGSADICQQNNQSRI